MASDAVVRARIDQGTKEKAARALEAMGLSVSDAIRLLMIRVAQEKRLPFEIKIPKPGTIQAMQELETGKGKRFDTLDALFDDLNE
jgi:DNA-damage-inducible protein J